MKKITSHRSATQLAPWMLFVIFTTCILTVLLTGSDLYKKIALRDQNSFSQRTAVQYLTTRIRQNDFENSIFVGDFHEGTPAISGNTLFLQEEIAGRFYYTKIYCHDGSLCELFAPTDLSFAPTDGQAILDVDQLFFTLEDGLLTAQFFFSDGTSDTLIYHLRSGKEIPS